MICMPLTCGQALFAKQLKKVRYISPHYLLGSTEFTTDLADYGGRGISLLQQFNDSHCNGVQGEDCPLLHVEQDASVHPFGNSNRSGNGRHARSRFADFDSYLNAKRVKSSSVRNSTAAGAKHGEAVRFRRACSRRNAWPCSELHSGSQSMRECVQARLSTRSSKNSHYFSDDFNFLFALQPEGPVKTIGKRPDGDGLSVPNTRSADVFVVATHQDVERLSPKRSLRLRDDPLFPPTADHKS